jgi:rubrerythrin
MPPMATATPSTVNRDWIAAEFSKGIHAEQELIDEAKSRADSPPDPSLQVLYHEIAAADERHRGIVETIATRYGHTPSRRMAGGIGETLGRLKEKVGEIGANPLQRVSHDLVEKANAIHWYTAWVRTFEVIGDVESARELAAVLTEETSHRDALQEGLNRLVIRGAQGEGASEVK